MADGLLVTFEKQAVHLKAKSEKSTNGRPMYEDRVFVKIIPIGDNKTEIVREATEADKSRFAEEWDRYQRGEEQLYSGTPLKEWPSVQPSQIKMLEHFHIYVVEQLVELDDASIQRLGPGARELQAKAKAFVAKARDNAAVEKYAADNERMANEMESLKAQLKEVSNKIAESDELRLENIALKEELAEATSDKKGKKAA